MSGRWVDSLPALSWAGTQADALGWMVEALRVWDAGDVATRHLGYAGAHLRAWRKQREQELGYEATRVEWDSVQTITDRQLILLAIQHTATMFAGPNSIRWAEACLRELWHRGQL